MEFKKKTYTKIDGKGFEASPHFSTQTTSSKKIVATNTLKGLREEFKRTFLPFLIDVFELRQTIENAKLKSEGTPFIRETKSPEEILERLTQMRESILETQRWCEGMIGQIAKGIDEATEVVSLMRKQEEVLSEQR